MCLMPAMRIDYTTSLLVLAAAVAGAQQPQTPECPALLAALRSRVEENYAGYHLEVRGRREREYAAIIARLTREAASPPRGDCLQVLQQFTEWFADPHLFIFQSTRLDSAETARRALAVRRSDVTEARAQAYFAQSDGRRDPIEGIWYDGSGLRVAVLPDPDSGARFMAVVITSDTSAWPIGAVRATLRRGVGGAYVVEHSARNFAVRHLRGVIHKEVILRLSPGIWAREYPAPARPGLVHEADPRRPTLVSDGVTVIISMVSHDPVYAPVVDSLITAHDTVLRQARQLIVDLRGNEGGSSWISNPLLPFMRSAPRRARAGANDTAVMLSSRDQIAYARRAFGSDTSAFVREVVRRLTASPGELVALPESFGGARDTLVLGQARVAVIVDGGTVSAAEVLVLRAKESTRATVYGVPTAGALDYQSTNVVRILPDESRWLLGYPTITASRHLPRGGMRGTGIAPDVRLDVMRLWEPIADVRRRLAQER